MNAGARLALYGASVLVAFGAAYGIAAATVPEAAVAAWATGGESEAQNGGRHPDRAQFSAVAETAQINGFAVSVSGSLVPGTLSELSFTIARDGEPMTLLAFGSQTFGSLVAFDGNNASTAVVSLEDVLPSSGNSVDPTITLSAQPPSATRYVLYLDFQVDEQTHTAKFTFEPTSGGAGDDTRGDKPSEGIDSAGVGTR